MYRERKLALKYHNEPKRSDCPFCHEVAEQHILVEGKSWVVIANKYPYSYWEGRRVLSHLLLVPKKHARSLADLEEGDRQEIVEQMAKYESDNYGIYARSVHSGQKSVPMHQHTHLIKTDDSKARIFLFIHKPYLLFRK
jgi:diadenosine tetraphosphate (Ap4A) HIT family hydrolase